MIKAKVTTKQRDTGEKKLRAELNRLKKGPGVKIGVLENAGNHKSENDHEEILTVAAVATFNEYGTETIPERSFIRSTMTENESALLEYSRELKGKVLKGELKTEEALGLMGMKIQSLIQRKIDSIDSPPNSPETIARKGSSKPLIDTGQLRQSITYALVLDGKKGDS
jgi:hypothetical protein